MVPIMAVGFDYGVELTFPVGESFSTGILMGSCSTFTIIYTLVSSYFIGNKDQQGTDLTYIILTSACGIALVLCLKLSTTLKRY